MNLAHHRPLASWIEQEADGCGGVETGLTVLLAGPACPLSCTMCDLHRTALPHPSPPGAIANQISHAIEAACGDDEIGPLRFIKLYNAGNFFDSQSIPPADYPAIAKQVESFDRVIVENHPRIGPRLLDGWQSRVKQLEIAIGMESVQPGFLRRIDKRTTRDEIDRYSLHLSKRGVDVRYFLIHGGPGISVAEADRWTRLSLRHALRMSPRHVAVIPARSGNGWGNWTGSVTQATSKDLDRLHQAMIADRRRPAASGHSIQTVVTIDTWNFHQQHDPFLESIRKRNLDPT